MFLTMQQRVAMPVRQSVDQSAHHFNTDLHIPQMMNPVDISDMLNISTSALL